MLQFTQSDENSGGQMFGPSVSHFLFFLSLAWDGMIDVEDRGEF